MKKIKRLVLLSLLIPVLFRNTASSFAEENQTGETGKVESLEFKKVETEKSEEKNYDAKEKEEGFKEKIVYSFTTKSTPEEINGVLKAGKKYILRERKAIDGYKKAEDIEFIVRKDGVEQEIKVINEKINEEPKKEKPKKSKRFFPKTNINNRTMIFSLLLFLVGVVGSIIFYRKRKNNDEE